MNEYIEYEIQIRELKEKNEALSKTLLEVMPKKELEIAKLFNETQQLKNRNDELLKEMQVYYDENEKLTETLKNLQSALEWAAGYVEGVQLERNGYTKKDSLVHQALEESRRNT